MFTIDPNPTFKHPVKVQVPIDGGHREEIITATFAVMPTDEVEKLDMLKSGPTTEFLRRIIVRLDGLVDTSKQPVSYSDEVRDQVLRLPYARLALTDAYLAAISKAKSGN